MNSQILVLMSTYNGERFIKEQIDSILNQRDVNVSLLVRDDGSTDNTLNILNEYKDRGLLTYYTGENLGPQRSFMHLLKNAPGCDYYAFADQDDVWIDDKLVTAKNALDAYDKESPALYFSQTTLVDSNLNIINQQNPTPKLTFGESLIYFYASGCTMVMNKALRDVIIAYQPGYLYMHDMWIYMVAKAINANVVYDNTSHILYRQHENNVIGLQKGSFTEFKRRYRRLVVNKEHVRQRMAIELLNGYGRIIPENNLELLTNIVDYRSNIRNRIGLLFNSKLHPGDLKTLILSKFAILFGTL